MNEVDYPKTVTAVQSLLLNCQPSYNSIRQYQSNGINNQLMITWRGKSEDNEGETKDEKQKPLRNIGHIICNGCGEKGHYAGTN